MECEDRIFREISAESKYYLFDNRAQTFQLGVNQDFLDYLISGFYSFCKCIE